MQPTVPVPTVWWCRKFGHSFFRPSDPTDRSLLWRVSNYPHKPVRVCKRCGFVVELD